MYAFQAEVECIEPQDHHALQTTDWHESRHSRTSTFRMYVAIVCVSVNINVLALHHFLHAGLRAVEYPHLTKC